jgi:hypothetical protein
MPREQPLQLVSIVAFGKNPDSIFVDKKETLQLFRETLIGIHEWFRLAFHIEAVPSDEEGSEEKGAEDALLFPQDSPTTLSREGA